MADVWKTHLQSYVFIIKAYQRSQKHCNTEQVPYRYFQRVKLQLPYHPYKWYNAVTTHELFNQNQVDMVTRGSNPWVENRKFRTHALFNQQLDFSRALSNVCVIMIKPSVRVGHIGPLG